MRRNHLASLMPAATFVVERVQGKGYRVTSADGIYAEEWQDYALALLDDLGQPDPNGPQEAHYWLRPPTPSGVCVGVSVILRPDGEARYHEAWFRLPEATPRSKRSICLLVLFLLVGIIGGVLAGRGGVAWSDKQVGSRSSSESSHGVRSGDGGNNSATGGPQPDMHWTQLKNGIASSHDVREKLREYLSQEGFAADISAPVIDEKRSVKLIADLDKTPPPRETIRLSNVEVTKLLTLFESLDEWTTGAHR